MPALRLKLKLVFAITGMVVVIVATLSTLYISEVVKLRLQETQANGDFVANEILEVAKIPLQVDLSSTNVNLDDPLQVEDAIADVLQTDQDVNALLESVIGFSPTIQDATITGPDGRALVHTLPLLVGKTIKRRQDFVSIAQASIWKQLGVIYGPAQVYDARLPFRVNEVPLEVRVGISTLLLKDSIQPILTHSLISTGVSILVCLLLAAGLSNFALRPLSAISLRLDQISSGQVELPESPAQPSDEYGAVTSKIDRLGRQMRDVKEVFSALKENLDQMMANLQDGVMLFTSDFKVVLVSASAERFVGKPRGDMLGSYPQEIFYGDSRLGRAILEGFMTRTPGQEEIELENGRRIQFSLDFIEERGERIGALLTLRDAESVHRIEDEIELSRRLAAIGRLTSGVAHEVKNPINAIVVHLEVLRQKLSQVDPDTRRHMDVIGTEIKRLDRVVQTLVDFTRPVELRLTDLDLRKLVEEVVALASPEAERHKVLIERNPAPEPLPVRVDADLMKQAVLNIVINGVQAMSASGGNLSITSRREGDGAVLTVRDEGPGIPADIRDKIYNLYFTTKKGGSGIGLPMAYRVLQLHNGALEFDSIEGSGATFVLRVPLTEIGEATEQPAAAPDSVKTA
jgi:signal transduction histidine kinase